MLDPRELVPPIPHAGAVGNVEVYILKRGVWPKGRGTSAKQGRIFYWIDFFSPKAVTPDSKRFFDRRANRWANNQTAIEELPFCLSAFLPLFSTYKSVLSLFIAFHFNVLPSPAMTPATYTSCE